MRKLKIGGRAIMECCKEGGPATYHNNECQVSIPREMQEMDGPVIILAENNFVDNLYLVQVKRRNIRWWCPAVYLRPVSEKIEDIYDE